MLKPEQIKESIDSFKKYLRCYDVRKPKIISLHLGFSAEDVDITGEDDHNYAISEVYTEADTLKTFSESLRILSEWSESLDIPVAVENLDYHEGGAYEYICKPEFIKNLLNKNPKINLLLDIAHAEISAHNLGEELKEYFGKLPLEKVIEIHLNSPDKRFYDMHLPARKKELKIIRSFKEDMPNLKVINLEYHSKRVKPEKLKEDINYLRSLF